MKNVLMIFALVFGMNALVLAQGKGNQVSVETRATKAADKWKTELGLTDTQRQQFYDAKVQQLTKKKDILAKHGQDKKKAGAELKANNAEFDAKVKTIFTDEQYTKWKTKKEEYKKQRLIKKGKNGKLPSSEEIENEIDDL